MLFMYVFFFLLSFVVLMCVGNELGVNCFYKVSLLVVVVVFVFVMMGLLVFMFVFIMKDKWVSMFIFDFEILWLMFIVFFILGLCEFGNCF